MSTKSIMRKLRALMMRTLPMMLTCRELDDFIVDYIEGVLPKRQQRTFELHIRLCPDCRRYLDAYKRTIALVGQTALHELAQSSPEPVPEELIKAILAARREGS